MHRAVEVCTATTAPLDARRIAVLVPSRGAGEALRRTLEALRFTGTARLAFVPPEICTRADFYQRLYENIATAPPMLSELEREVLFRKAARAVSDAGTPAPFSLRPGLIVEILAFYDELRRRHKTVADFERLTTESLASSVDIDRGAERLMRQTRFLTAAFAEFERSVDASGRIDEHQLRALAIAATGSPAFRRIAVTIADQAADVQGLWNADYDLLTRLPGVEQIDVIATESILAAGFHQRIHDLLPGIEEVAGPPPSAAPTLVIPGPPPPRVLSGMTATPDRATNCYVCRDREEELAEVVRGVKTGEATGKMAVIFQRPLPYLYLARNVFADAQLPYDALDALPLAGEPFAAAIDLVFTAAISEATRSSLLELLRSPHWRFTTAEGEPLQARELAALDAFLLKMKYLGGWTRLAGLKTVPRHERAEPALSVAIAICERLQAFSSAANASSQIDSVLQFVADYERLPDRSDPWFGPHLRARGAILSALRALAAAHLRHDDRPLSIPELAATVRRWIEGQTFSPRTGATGIELLDAAAAAYAEVDHARVVGLVESDWPDRSRRNIFYPGSLLSPLGWPVDSDRLAAARGRFQDLLRLPRERISLSSFTLEGDAIVSPSVLLEEVDAAGLTVERAPLAAVPVPRVFLNEALAEDPVLPEAVERQAAEWLGVRMSRIEGETNRFRGAIGPQAVPSHAVSHLERYLECPFKYFARYVLTLEEERNDESVLSPQERGQLLHEVFEQFFSTWHDSGRGAIDAENLSDALSLFERIVEARLALLSEADRALERTYLLGSAAAPGLAARAFAVEIEHGAGVVERLLEYALEGEFEFKGESESRRLKIRAKADRIDLLDDGTLRIIDYKLTRAPKAARALQLPVYGVCATQRLAGRHGRQWAVSRAGYIAFKERNAFVSLGGSGSVAAALAEGQERLLSTVAAIERGEFPVDPDEPFFCTRCGYSAVCRKDYVGDE